ncbi:MAG TPA: tRNA glutamyl-Q(34) synthetase GluQRS [Pseudomonadales bacterium]|nr:tRNA glutamyl-Q(34) synthetase GluQRS [Pseudomonadales bacterium]
MSTDAVTEHTAARGDAYVGRFAPSPSGPLHLGSLFAAVVGWLDARAVDGRWLLRIEDIDPPREIPGSADAILEALERHGLEWDGPVLRQRDRDAAYREALARLDAAGRLFECTCSRRELRAGGGVYPGTCRRRARRPGRPAALRVRVDDAPIAFRDRACGAQQWNLAEDGGDFVVRRKDGLWAYQLAVVVDDGWQGITDVVRGVDLLDSTPRQIHLQRLLGLPTPRYLHFPVLRRAGEGSKLSKQAGAAAIDPAQAPRNLARVLAWLDLPADPRMPVGEQLAQARAIWSPAHLPDRDLDVADAPA